MVNYSLDVETNQELQELIDFLKNDLYVTVGVSKIHGVGLIAIRDIPKETNVRKEPPLVSGFRLKVENLDELHPNVLKLIYGWNGHDNVVDIGLTPHDQSHYWKYINHSKDPNIYYKKIKPTEFMIFDEHGMITNKDIKEGEELTINYNDIVWDEEFGSLLNE